MSIQAILLPLFVEVALTFVLLFWMAGARVAVVRRGDVHPRDVALREPNWPKQETQIANAYQNQLELPVLFYVLTILAIITRHADFLFVVLAWVFVVLRLLHVYIHLTSNRLARRFAVFAAGAVVLAVMWAIFIVRLLVGFMTPAARLSPPSRFSPRSRRGGGRPPMRSRIGAWRIASPAPATAPRSPAWSTTRCAAGRRAPLSWATSAARAVLLGMLRLERKLDSRGDRAARRRRALCAAAADRRGARASSSREPRRRAALRLPATIPNGSIRISPASSARSAPPRAPRSRAARRSICASTRSRPSAMRRPRRSPISTPQPTRWSPVGLRITLAADAKSPAIHAEPAFIKGMIEIQDEGSQLAALLAGAKPGEQVVDLCAGAGGKTLALAAAMENHGQIYATDIDKRRLAPIHDRLERAGARNVQVRTPQVERQRARRPRRPHRSGADRRALHRHRRLAAQSRRQMAGAARRAGRAREGAGGGARPRRRRW